MKRNLFFIFCVIIIFTTKSSFLRAEDSSENIQVPVGTMVIKAPAHFQTKKTPVRFSHSTHLKFSCIACHHEWDRLSPIQGCTSSGCHERLKPSPPSGKPSQKKKIISLTGAYHKACRGCHRKQKKQAIKIAKTSSGRKSNLQTYGPITCEGCHPETFMDKEDPLTSFSLPLGMIQILPPEGVEAKRSSVNFPHSLHFDQDCQVCHHEWEDGREVKNCTASGCHDQLEADESSRNISDPKNKKYFLTAYHKTCFHCHLKLKKQKNIVVKTDKLDGKTPLNKNAPIRCNGCHNGE